MKKKIEDYYGKKVAIYANSKEELSQLVNLHPESKRRYQNLWSYRDSNELSHAVRFDSIDDIGHCSKSWYEERGYELLPATDFIEEIEIQYPIFN